MRLLNVETLEIEEFVRDTPSYAILSHTWGNEEVLYHDVLSKKSEQKQAWSKIENCCIVAKTDGWSHVWIDTCCIDKSDSAELSEAINSMFKWYQQSGVCYAYLSDVSDDDNHHWSRQSQFQQSRWFTRGWTLQELLAPPHVIFFNQSWREIGTRSSLAGEIEQITRIADLDIADLTKVSVATKFSWASGRQTTRIEDEAYSLMGLFNVNMPLLYGEGKEAFQRLQLQILGSTDDESLFAWTVSGDRIDAVSGLLAPSAAAFASSCGIEPLQGENTRAEYAMTNKGFRIELDLYEYSGRLPEQYLKVGHSTYVTPLLCGWIGQSYSQVGIILQKGTNNNEFFRPLYVPLVSWRGSKEAPSRQRLYIKQHESPEPRNKRFLLSVSGPDEIELHGRNFNQVDFQNDDGTTRLIIEPGARRTGLTLRFKISQSGRMGYRRLYLALTKREDFLMMALGETSTDNDDDDANSVIEHSLENSLFRQLPRPIEQASLVLNTGHYVSVTARPVAMVGSVHENQGTARKFHIELKLSKNGTGPRVGGGHDLYINDVQAVA